MRPLAPFATLLAMALPVPVRAQVEPPRPSFPELPESAPAGSGVLQPCMEELEGVVRCGRYRVWEDRETKAGRTIDLGFVVADALNPNAEASDAVTYFFGGPGSSVTRPSSFIIQGRRDLREKRDLLFLDFRGVGASQPLDCAVPYPRGVESRFGELFPLDHITVCRDHLAQRTRLDLYTTDINMDDLEELRRWLNYTALNLNGGSYGTREIQAFLRRHPASARTVVMNGVTPISGGVYVYHARRLHAALDELVAECGRDEACSEAYPDLGATLQGLLERVRTDPPTVMAEGKPVPFGPGEFGYALRGLLYGRGRELPSFLARAAVGEWQPLADYYLQRSGWVSEAGGEAGMHFSVICAEDISQFDSATIDRETAGTFLGDYLAGGYAKVCAVWPYAELDDSYWSPVQSDVPTLLFSGTHDPVTPPSGAEEVARTLTNSRHIVVEGAGHGVFGDCARTMELHLVETGGLDGLNDTCLEEIPPPEFVLPSRP